MTISIILILFFLLFPNFSIAQENDGINDIIQENLKESTDLFIKNTGEDIQQHVRGEVKSASSEIANKIDVATVFNYIKETTTYWISQLWNTVISSFKGFGVNN